jgi:hypothetical protein
MTRRVMVTAARAMATKVSCNKESGGDGGKSDGNEGGGQATVTATMWVMAMVTRLVGNERKSARVARAMAMVMRADGDGDSG